MNAYGLTPRGRRTRDLARAITNLNQGGSLEQEVQQVEATVGQKVNVLEANWTELLQMGVIIKLHIGRKRLTMQLTTQDLGLPPNATKEMQDIFSLGEKALMDKKLLAEAANAESRGRAVITNPRKGVLQTPLGPFATFTAFGAVMAELNEIEQEYMAVPQRIVDNYDTLKAMMKDAYTVAAKKAYQRIRMEAEANKLIVTQTEEEFTTQYVDTILHRIPSAKDIAASFYWEVELSYAPTATALVREAAEIEKIQADISAALEETEGRRDIARQKRQVIKARLDQEEMVARTAAQQREIQLREMNAKVVENTRKKLEDLNSNMISSIQQQIYRTALECAEDALAALTRNNQQAKGRGGASQLANIIETVRRLNFANDETLNAFMVKMQAELAEAAGQAIKPTSINETLEAISVLMRRNLAAMGETAPERKPELGPQELTLDLVRRARRTLDLPEDLPMPGTKTERKLM